MGIYRTTDVRIFSDEKFRELSPVGPSGQYLFLYLQLGPHTGPIPGLFRLSKGTLADELGWSVETVSERFMELFERGMAKADWDAKLVWLPNAFKHHQPANPNIVKGWAKHWPELPECDLKNQALRHFIASLERFDERFRNAFETVSEPFRNKEQEQEQEQEQDLRTICHVCAQTLTPDQSADQTLPIEVGAKAPGLFADGNGKSNDVQEIWQYYRTHHPQTAKTLRPGRKEYKLIRARLEDFDVQTIKDAIDGYHVSDWHTGANPDKRRYLGIHLICRTISHIEAGLGYLEQSRNGNRAGPRQLDRSVITGDIEPTNHGAKADESDK